MNDELPRAQWVARLTRNVEVVGSSPIKGSRCFLEQETLALLLSTGSVGSRNGFERDITIKLVLVCVIKSLVLAHS